MYIAPEHLAKSRRFEMAKYRAAGPRGQKPVAS